MMEAELYTVNLLNVTLSFMPHPRGYDWLPGEMASYHARGVRLVVSLLTEAEIWLSGLMYEMEASTAAGIHFVSFPIVDHDVPPFTEATFAFIASLAAEVRAGTHVAIHCWAGIGRSALMAASVLVAAGVNVHTAVRELSRVRGFAVPETTEQELWVARYARQLAS